MVLIPESLVNTFEGSIFLNILGGIISSTAFAIILYLWQKPWLQLYREPIEIKDTDDKHFYHIVVKNNGHRTAYNCKVDVVFNSKNLRTPISIPYAKWASNPEPVIPMAITKPNGDTMVIDIPHRTLLKSTWYIDIPPKSCSSFALLLKYRDDIDCYAFNGENYIIGYTNGTDLKMSSRNIGKGEFVARIVVTGDNTKCSGEYYVVNEGKQFSDLKIIPY